MYLLMQQWFSKQAGLHIHKPTFFPNKYSGQRLFKSASFLSRHAEHYFTWGGELRNWTLSWKEQCSFKDWKSLDIPMTAGVMSWVSSISSKVLYCLEAIQKGDLIFLDCNRIKDWCAFRELTALNFMWPRHSRHEIRQLFSIVAI